MKTIGVNALHLKWGINAGTETYFTNIVRPWYSEPQPGFRFVLFCNALPPWWVNEKPWFTAVVLPAAHGVVARIFYEQVWFPLQRRARIDALFNPGYVGSILLRTPQIIAVHDGYAWRFPDEVGHLRSLYWRFAIPRSVGRHNAVICISESSARDVQNFCHVGADRVHVIHAAGAHLRELSTDSTLLARLGLIEGEYFHCVGIFKAIKNPLRILDAFEAYVSTSPHAAKKKLVLVGRADGEFAQALEARARQMPHVVLAGRLSDLEVATLYRSSAALVFVSLYEGFGIPILEAQSLNCPVITSNVSSMPEVAGAGALIVNPLSVTEIAGAMQQLDDPNLRRQLVTRGTDNLDRFSWPKASAQTLELLAGRQPMKA